MPRTDDLGDDLPLHNTADVDWRGIGLGVVHASAHVGIQRKKLRRHEDLSIKRIGHWTGLQTKISRPGQAPRPRPKPPVCRDPSQAPGARPLDNGKVQTLHGNVAGDFYMAPSVPRRSEMPRFKTWRSDVAALVRKTFEPPGGEMSRMEANMSCGSAQI